MFIGLKLGELNKSVDTMSIFGPQSSLWYSTSKNIYNSTKQIQHVKNKFPEIPNIKSKDNPNYIEFQNSTKQTES